MNYFTKRKIKKFIQRDENVHMFINQISNDLDFYDFSQSEQDELLETGFLAHIIYRKLYIDKIKEPVLRLTETLCLFIYLYKYNSETIDIDNEWKYILFEHIHNIRKSKVIDSNSTERTFKYVIYNIYKFDCADEIYKLISDKFKENDIDVETEKERIYKVIKIFQRILLDDLIDIFYYKQYRSIYKYITEDMLSKIKNI